MSADRDPLDLGGPIASGRSADLFDLGDGRLLRRRRTGDVPAGEAAAMRLAEAAGYPVPHVHSVAGSDMVLDRVEGPTMLDVLGARPWRAVRYGRLLGDLQVRLRPIAPDDEVLRRHEPVEALVHSDLHPGNVLMSPTGPVVIDWESARAGPSDFDAATTWLLTDTADVDAVPIAIRPILSVVRSVLNRSFLRRVGMPRPTTVDLVCDIRLDDTNMRPDELDRIRAFRARHGTGASS